MSVAPRETGTPAPIQLDSVGDSHKRSAKPTYCLVFLTRRCNLDCGYCHMAHSGRPDPEKETLERGVDLFMRSADNVCFHLFGGEPLLRFDLVKHLVDYVARTYPGRPVQYLITTNGLLLKPHIIDWLVAHDVEIMLSLDGTYDSQGHWRVLVDGNNARAYEVTCQHIETLTARGVPHFLNMCVSPENADRMVENVRHMRTLGVKRVQLAYELGGMWDAPARAAYLAGLRRVIEELHEDGAFEIMNSPDAEPVLGNMTFALDTNGDLYRGCAIVLEQHMPTFNDSTFCGRLDEVESVQPFIRSKFEQTTGFLKYTRKNPHDWKILRSNYHLGYQVKKLLTKMGHRAWGDPD
ncbi:MAG: radical SAM protein [Deltaproteobacteria bacterium]|nr:MAG: radical SAM protein [Deltaproteobacteria bacterium]